MVLSEMYSQMDSYYRFLGGTQLEAEDRARLADQQLWLSERQGDAASVRSTKRFSTSQT